MWWWILAACALAFATKFVGFLLPRSLLERQSVLRVTAAMTVGLLASLIATNGFSTGALVVFDARAAALAVAVTALVFQIPFLLVVVLGAASSALVRLVTEPAAEPWLSLAVCFGCAALVAVRVLRARRHAE